MAYCTPTEARAAGAVGDDATLAPLIADAQRRVDRYTDDLWEPTVTKVVARVSRDGTALLPRRPQSVTDVRAPGSQTPIPSTGYQVLSSSAVGQVDAVVLGGQGLADPLVLGAEPWAGGYRNLFWGAARSGTGQVEVTGTFGHSTPPQAVRRATAAIVAALQRPAGALDVDDEGNAVSITTAPVVVPGQTTGSADADVLLGPLRRRAGVRVS